MRSGRAIVTAILAVALGACGARGEVDLVQEGPTVLSQDEEGSLVVHVRAVNTSAAPQVGVEVLVILALADGSERVIAHPLETVPGLGRVTFQVETGVADDDVVQVSVEIAPAPGS